MSGWATQNRTWSVLHGTLVGLQNHDFKLEAVRNLHINNDARQARLVLLTTKYILSLPVPVQVIEHDPWATQIPSGS